MEIVAHFTACLRSMIEVYFEFPKIKEFNSKPEYRWSPHVDIACKSVTLKALKRQLKFVFQS